VEQLLDSVLGTVDLESIGRGHVPGRGQAEAALSTIYDRIEEEAERRLLVHIYELRLIVVSYIHERIVDPEPLRKTLTVIQALLDYARLRQEALRLAATRLEMLALQPLGEEVVVDARRKSTLESIHPVLLVDMFPDVRVERLEDLVVRHVQLLRR